MRVARAAQERTLRCGERFRSSTEARALQAIPPAPGTIIGHVTGRVIWDSPNLLASPGVSDATSGMASMRPSPNVRVAGEVGGRVRRSPRWRSALRLELMPRSAITP
jgi:hypothetical protein